MEYLNYNADKEETLRYIAKQLAIIADGTPSINNHSCSTASWVGIDDFGFIFEARPYAKCDLCGRRRVTMYKIVLPHWFKEAGKTTIKPPNCLECKNEYPQEYVEGRCTCVGQFKYLKE